jgi:hypothetical protein
MFFPVCASRTGGISILKQTKERINLDEEVNLRFIISQVLVRMLKNGANHLRILYNLAAGAIP